MTSDVLLGLSMTDRVGKYVHSAVGKVSLYTIDFPHSAAHGGAWLDQGHRGSSTG